jgi:hypothetical protein
MEQTGEILKLLEWSNEELETKVDEISRQLAKKIDEELAPYFYLDAVSKGNTGHIGFCTYRN